MWIVDHIVVLCTLAACDGVNWMICIVLLCFVHNIIKWKCICTDTLDRRTFDVCWCCRRFSLAFASLYCRRNDIVLVYFRSFLFCLSLWIVVVVWIEFDLRSFHRLQLHRFECCVLSVSVWNVNVNEDPQLIRIHMILDTVFLGIHVYRSFHLICVTHKAPSVLRLNVNREFVIQSFSYQLECISIDSWLNWIKTKKKRTNERIVSVE